MMESSLDNFTTVIHPLDLGDSAKEEDRILGFVISHGSAFSTEMSRHLMIRSEVVTAIILKLVNDGILKRIVPNHWVPQPLIMCRIANMREQGVDTYEKFIQRSWFHATEEGIYQYAMKHNGEHRQMNTAYVEHFNLEIAPETSS